MSYDVTELQAYGRVRGSYRAFWRDYALRLNEHFRCYMIIGLCNATLSRGIPIDNRSILPTVVLMDRNDRYYLCWKRAVWQRINYHHAYQFDIPGEH